jgi:ribosomal protein L11 methyltransferase
MAELLSETFGEACSTYTDFETKKTTVTLFLKQKPVLHGRVQVDFAAGLGRIRNSGLRVPRTKMFCAKVRNENWAESWKRHFKPLEIGTSLLVKPSWSLRRAKKGQATVVIDPGLSFGTGQHPTTAFCLDQLATHKVRGKKASCLDMGTGSGILAIAAAKLGYQPVDAFDFDPEVIQVAVRNARRNRVGRKIQFTRKDATKLPRRFDRKYSIICANLISNLLLETKHRILARLSSEGLLVVAGILKSEFRLLQREYERDGLRLIVRRDQNEWSSGSFGWVAFSRQGRTANRPWLAARANRVGESS